MILWSLLLFSSSFIHPLKFCHRLKLEALRKADNQNSEQTPEEVATADPEQGDWSGDLQVSSNLSSSVIIWKPVPASSHEVTPKLFWSQTETNRNKGKRIKLKSFVKRSSGMGALLGASRSFSAHQMCAECFSNCTSENRGRWYLRKSLRDRNSSYKIMEWHGLEGILEIT